MHYAEPKGLLSGSNAYNVYRGCAHGCIYCDSRSRCYHIEHDFEDIEVKRNAPALLEAALRSRRSKSMLSSGSMCDPYQPVEETERLTRQCLEVVARYGFGLTILTKSDRILQDTDHLLEVHRRGRCVAQMTLTTYDESLCRILEPNVSTTRERVEALAKLHDAGLPTVVWMTPTLPFLNDTEENLRGLLAYCFDAGVRGILAFDMGVTLREGDREYFYGKLDEHFPGLKRRYAQTYGLAYECPSPNSERLWRIFSEECEKHGVLWRSEDIFRYLHVHDFDAGVTQMSLF